MSMDKRITFIDDETGENVDFIVEEEIKLNNNKYLFVTEVDDEESFLILKDTSKDEDIESIYMIVENEEELNEVLEKFKVLFEDTDIIIE
jgi:hypothetical protein